MKTTTESNWNHCEFEPYLCSLKYTFVIIGITSMIVHALCVSNFVHRERKMLSSEFDELSVSTFYAH